MSCSKRLRRGLLAAASATGLLAAATAHAQEAQEVGRGAADALLDEVVVTATKQSTAQLSQRVPITISAFSEQQIEALKIPDLMALATSIPSVSFEQTTAKATANFSIRGLGINSSKVSTAPSVGVFVNGVYLGVNQGVYFDTFDLDGVEVLRGPQGTLFGRNVTGGAVLLRYKRPQGEPDLKLRARVESGPEYSFAVAGGGPITEAISGRVAMFYDKDLGYFEAPLLGDKHYPKSESFSIRPSLRYRPNDQTDVTLFTEAGRVSGEAPPAFAPDYVGGTPTVPGTLPRTGYRYDDLLVQVAGETYLKWYGATLDARQEVSFGENASITSIAGYRNLKNFSYGDLDATPIRVVETRQLTDQDQFSEELRYNGTFGPATVTVGGYYFHQNALQMTNFVTTGATQGGRIVEDVYGVFGQVDYELTEGLTLQVGGRYTYEKKHAKIAAQASETPGVRIPGANGVPGSCRLSWRDQPYGCAWTFDQKANYRNFSPKVTLQYQVAPTAQLYATAQKAYRSGGFNIAYNAAFAQTPYDPEKQRAFEVGFKTDLFDRRTRLNGAVYLTKIRDLQRDITVFDPVLLVTTQQTANTADATIKGFELELVQQLTRGVVLTANVGRTHARYDKIRFDITADPASAGGPQVTAFDYQQRLPRVLPWTYGLGLTADREFSFGNVTVRGSWTHRDEAYFADYNNHRRDGADVTLPAAELFDAQVTFEPPGSAFTISLYGRNLANEYTMGNFTPIAYPNLRGCACYPNEGRVLGAEISRAF
jgi:iron complex outermembrane receptor protein